jgi:ferrous iron transport protein B
MEAERGLDRAAAIADMRYAFIKKVCSKTVIKPQEGKEYRRSRKIDRILTGKWTALPIFLVIMALVIWLTIDVLGAPLQEWLDQGIGALSDSVSAAFEKWNVSEAVRSLVVDGIFGGVGSVLSFLPIIVILFFFLSMLEDSGYMARVAFVTDKLLRKIGLSGRSIVPLLIGLGCSVPGIMASRTLPSARDRKMTILLTPFMSCSAKLPIYAFLSAAFFPGHGGLVLICLYALGILTGIAVALIAKKVGYTSEAAPFVMELPNYRLPRAKNVGHLLWDKCKDFLQRAFTIIFVASIVIWFLQSFDFRFNMVENGEGSILAWIAGIVSPAFRPLGLGDWRIVTALVTGFLAKESVVSTMEVLGVTASLTVATAVPLLVFCLLYTPCVAAIASVKRELGGKWAWFVVLFQCVVAWIVALLAYWITMLII